MTTITYPKLGHTIIIKNPKTCYPDTNDNYFCSHEKHYPQGRKECNIKYKDDRDDFEIKCNKVDKDTLEFLIEKLQDFFKNEFYEITKLMNENRFFKKCNNYKYLKYINNYIKIIINPYSCHDRVTNKDFRTYCKNNLKNFYFDLIVEINFNTSNNSPKHSNVISGLVIYNKLGNLQYCGPNHFHDRGSYGDIYYSSSSPDFKISESEKQNDIINDLVYKLADIVDSVLNPKPRMIKSARSAMF